MKEFPKRLTPENKEKFSEYRYARALAYMRKDIYELILKGDENSYFEFDAFARQHSMKTKIVDKMKETVMSELKDLGWNVKTSFGGTGLFVYSTENPPPSCYEDEF